MEPRNFIQHIIDDFKKNNSDSVVVTRFPPEPNGYLHIGHAKSVCLNFTLAEEYGGRCHLRFDDTNPLSEDVEYVEAIKADIRWLGFDWHEGLFHASDYFDRLFEFAVALIGAGYAYVDDQSPEDIRKNRGSLTEPGTDSPFRDRTIDENLDLFHRMKSGEFPDGAKVLRAKIDMKSPNMNMRDPIIYRIRHAEHQATGDKWVIYPMYDFTHPLSDMIEGITHSICTLEFEDHRPLYDWLLDTLNTPCHPQQIEFARLNLDFTVTSKRKLLQLVEQNHVSGWDDPRMLTLKGLRRRGYTPSSIRKFCQDIGISKKNTTIGMSLLEQAIRDDLDSDAPRAMAVLDPLKVTIRNFAGEEVLKAPNHPKRDDMGEREVPLTKTIYIEHADFMEDPPKKYFRLKPGGKVRLRYGYVIECQEVIKDDSGNVVELICDYDDRTAHGVTPEGEKKVKGIIHWVSAERGIPAEVRIYDRLFSVPNPGGDKEKEFTEFLNQDSLKVLANAVVEPSLAHVGPEAHYQFERLGFFCSDIKDHKSDRPVFNRTVTLRDTWR